MGYYDFDNIDYQELVSESILFSQHDWFDFLSDMYDYFDDKPMTKDNKEKLSSLQKVTYKKYKLPKNYKEKIEYDAMAHAKIAIENPALLSIMRRWKNMDINEKNEHFNVFIDTVINTVGQDKNNIDVSLICESSYVSASARIGSNGKKDSLILNKYPFLFEGYEMHELSNTVYHELVHLSQRPENINNDDIVDKVIALNGKSFIYCPQELDFESYYYQPSEQHAYWAGSKFSSFAVDAHNNTQYATSKYSELEVKEIYQSGMIVKSRSADNEYHPYYDFYTAKHYIDTYRFRQDKSSIVNALNLFTNSFKYGEFFEKPFINGAKEIENVLNRRDINWQDIELAVAKSKAISGLKYMAKSPIHQVANNAFDTLTRITEFDITNPMPVQKSSSKFLLSSIVQKAKELVNG